MAPITRGSRSEKSFWKWLTKEEKKVSKVRAEMNRAKETLEKDRAEAKDKEIKIAKWKRLIELCSKENACIDRSVLLTLDIFDAEDKGDIAGAELLKQSRSELSAKHKEEIQAFMNGCGEHNTSEIGNTL